MKVSHVLKSGLVHGKYYKVYVTQVNTAGLESAKSAPGLVRVGDVTGPPTPVLAIDTGYGNGGYLKNNGAVNVGLKWTRPECDDLEYYILHHWHNYDWYTADGAYPASVAAGSTQSWASGTALGYVLASQKNQKTLCIGLQAVDISNNLSQISVIQVTPEDLSILDVPVNPITVTPGVWQITAYTVCPVSTEIAAVLWYRDNKTMIGAVPAYSQQPAIIVDQLSVETGLSHFYTYCYVDKNGNYSPRSAASATVTAKTIDTTMLDKASLEALLNAWNSVNVEDIESLKQDLLTQSLSINDQASRLKTVADNYAGLYDNYELLANQINLLSASVSETREFTSSLQTSYSQMSNQISLRAIKIDVDNALSSVQSASVAAINVQADRITNVVSNLSNNVMAYSSIAQLYNGLQLKVSRGEVVAAINMSPETIQIASRYFHVTGDMIADGTINARKLMQNSISLDYLLKSAWPPHWRKYIYPGNEYNGVTNPWQYPATHKNIIWQIAEPSLGGIHYGQGQNNFDVPAILWEMNVWCDYPQVIAQVLRVCDDELNYYVNGVHVHSSGTYQGARVLYTQLYGGNNLIQIVLNNKGWGQTALVLQGDIINNTSIRFNG